MNIFALITVISAKALPKIQTPVGKYEALKQLIPEASLQEYTNSIITVEHDGRILEFDQEDIEGVQKTIGLFKEYSNSQDDIDFYKNILKIEEETEEEALKNGRKSFAILFIDKDSIPKIKEINQPIRIFISTNKKLAEELKTPFPGIFGFNHEDGISYQLKVKDDFSKAIFSVTKPLFDLITNQNVHLYESSELKTFYILTKADDFKKIKEDFKKVAVELKNESQFCLMRYQEGSTNIKAFGLKEEDLPAVIIVNEQKKYSLGKITHDSLKEFITKFNQNALNDYVLSQDEPQEQKDVKVITYNNSASLLNDPSKDKFVIFQAPWCHFCKAIKPAVDKLAEISKNNDNLLIGTYDMTENDPLKEYTVKGFPTIFLIKGETNEKILFTSKERNLKSFSDFIKENGHFKIDYSEEVNKELLKEAEEKKEEKKEEVKEEEESLDDYDYENESEFNEENLVEDENTAEIREDL